MANPKKGNSLLADKSGDPLFGDRQSNVADAAVTLVTLTATAPATLTAGAPNGLDVTWTGNDPGGTPNGVITINSGSAPTDAEMMEHLEEAEANFNLMETLALELIADHATSKTLQDELILDHAITITDLTTMKTKINAILDVLEEHGLMAAS